MKRFLLIGFVIFMYPNHSFSQFTLEIEITEIRNNTGNIMLQLFDENEKVLSQEIGKIIEKKCLFVFKILKAGKYAVRYYHDENSNSQMETNMFGKPTEGYGFSNNVTGPFGPPPFKKWLFEINGNKKITLKPSY